MDYIISIGISILVVAIPSITDSFKDGYSAKCLYSFIKVKLPLDKYNY